MKSAIAAFVGAAARFRAGHGESKGSISLLITGDEEGPAINGTVKMLRWLEENGEIPDVCLVGEPTNPTRLGEMVKIGRRGSLSGNLTVTGIQGHTAYPHLADNPVHRLLDMLRALTADPLDAGSDHFQPSTLQISTIDVGNPATNVIPASATARFNIRFNDHHTSDSLTEWLHEKFSSALGEGSARYELDIHVSGESFLTPPGPLSELLIAAVEQVTGRTPELSTTGGTSDARFIKDYCPVAEFGLVGQTMHQANENVACADIDTLSEIYRVVLEKYFASS
jgi:succinyl-diaminopimelate desuccinylase